jgi:hypothetical protein
MSELQHALELFEFLSIDDVTVNSLKKAFKTQIIRAHPDKGGDADLFDQMLRSYMYLTETVQRITGGRATLQNVVTPDELKEMRPDEIINRFFEEFDNDEFNKKFEEANIKETHGYSTWLSSKEEENNLTDGVFGDATQKPPTFNEKDFNKVFEQKVKEGKPEPSAIILHPEQMAYISGQCIGNEIIETTEGGYTSHIFNNPKYTDAYEAFSNLTITDKIPAYTETNKTLDDLIAERNKDVTPFNDTELQAIHSYEKMKLEKNINNLSKIKDHFQYDENAFSTGLTNWPPEKYSKESYNGFVMDF